MTTDGIAGGACGGELTRRIILRLTENAGTDEQARIAADIEQRMEEAGKRLEAKRAELKQREAATEQQQEHLRLIRLEEEEAERKKQREARKAKTKGMGMER